MWNTETVLVRMAERSWITNAFIDKNFKENLKHDKIINKKICKYLLGPLSKSEDHHEKGLICLIVDKNVIDVSRGISPE